MKSFRRIDNIVENYHYHYSFLMYWKCFRCGDSTYKRVLQFPAGNSDSHGAGSETGGQNRAQLLEEFCHRTQSRALRRIHRRWSDWGFLRPVQWKNERSGRWITGIITSIHDSRPNVFDVFFSNYFVHFWVVLFYIYSYFVILDWRWKRYEERSYGWGHH